MLLSCKSQENCVKVPILNISKWATLHRIQSSRYSSTSNLKFVSSDLKFVSADLKFVSNSSINVSRIPE